MVMVYPTAKPELAREIVDYLNELAQADRCAIAALIANRVPCNQLMAEHLTCQVAVQHGGFLVGMLGILNGLCGAYGDGPKRGYGLIAAEFAEPATPGGFRDLVRFVVTKNK